MNLEAAREVLLKHSQSPDNGRFPAAVTHAGKLTNPICGDHVELKFHVSGDVIAAAGFAAKSCAICAASASLLCHEVKGRNVKEALSLAQSFEDELLVPPEKEWPRGLQGLVSFQHLRVNPSRRACALLPWIALRSALKN